MAKTSKIAKNDRATVARWQERRTTAKATLRSPASSAPERAEAQRTLQRMPRDASPVRVRNRDVVDGRPRGYLRAFGLSRIRMRAMAHDGQLPGIRKASW